MSQLTLTSDNGGNFVPWNSGITTNKGTPRGLERSWGKLAAQLGRGWVLELWHREQLNRHSHSHSPCVSLSLCA